MKNGSEKILKTNHIIVAIGGRPKYLDVPGKEHCISSDDIFSLPKAPGKTLVIGAGCILSSAKNNDEIFSIFKFWIRPLRMPTLENIP